MQEYLHSPIFFCTFARILLLYGVERRVQSVKARIKNVKDKDYEYRW